MYDGMAQALESASGSSPIRCVVIAGAPGAFTAGNDLQDFLKAAMGGEGLGGSVMRFLHALARCERPLVAAVRGRRGRARHHDAAALRLCRSPATDARLPDAVRQSSGFVPEAASSLLAPAPDGSPPRIRAARDGQAAQRRGGEGLRARQRGRARRSGRSRGDGGGARRSPRCRRRRSRPRAS